MNGRFSNRVKKIIKTDSLAVKKEFDVKVCGEQAAEDHFLTNLIEQFEQGEDLLWE